MSSGDERRDRVIERYSGLARAAATRTLAADREAGNGCGPSIYAGADEVVGIPETAVSSSLACGNPVAVAELQPGEQVLDLGCGGGLDVLLSARQVGPAGRVYGLDAVISNCVLNLSTDKPRALAEAARVLRPGGRFGITDLIAGADLDAEHRAAADAQIACGVGTLTEVEYRDQLLAAGFSAVTITPTHEVADGLFSAIVQARTPAAPEGVVIRPMRESDAGPVLAIYQAGLDAGDASFETTAPDWATFSASKLPRHRYVAVEAGTGTVLGWVAAAPVSTRRVYAGVVEHSVYVHPDHQRRRIGAALLTTLIDSTESAGMWTLQTGVFPENAASLRLHEQAGFRAVGVRERIGQQHGRWRDVTFLERRRAG